GQSACVPAHLRGGVPEAGRRRGETEPDPGPQLAHYHDELPDGLLLGGRGEGGAERTGPDGRVTVGQMETTTRPPRLTARPPPTSGSDWTTQGNRTRGPPGVNRHDDGVKKGSHRLTNESH